MSNKVKYNLKNAHYAPLVIKEDGTPEWKEPVPIKGSVSLSLDAEGDESVFYADGVKYYVTYMNDGYSGDLEVALIPESFSIDIMGEVKDNNGVMVEITDAEPQPFALLFQFDGDAKGIRHVMYNCKAGRPKVEGKTTEGSKEPQTDTLSITSSPLEDGQVKSKTSESVKDDVYSKWFEEVYYKPLEEIKQTQAAQQTSAKASAKSTKAEE